MVYLIMKRLYRKTAKVGYKICNRCNKELPANLDVFLRDSSRKDGLAYECRECHRARKLGRDRRKERWSNMTDEQREKATERNKKYVKTPKGRAIMLRKAYSRIDECDFTTDELMEILANPCVHCGTVDYPRGLDRIDNNLGHVKGNVAPSCAACNFARGNRFSFEEMKEIGRTIRKVLSDRLSNLTQSEDHP